MKKKLLLATLLLCVYASASTSITGTVGTLGGGVVTSGTFVRFWLRGCGGNQPRVNGVGLIAPTQGGVFYFDFPVNGSGAVGGSLYSTRDATGLLAGDIECGGNKTSVWYGMQAFTGGKGGPEVAVHAKNSATLDISNVTPITTNPVVQAPTGDSTYCRLDGGNGSCGSVGNVNTGTNNTFTATNIFSGAGVYTNTQMNLTTQALLNGLSPSTEFVASHPAIGFTTDAFTAGALIPPSATVLEVNAHGGYVQSTCNSSGDTKCVGIAAYFQGRANANGASVQGVNSLIQDQVGITGAYLKNEFDLNPNGSPVYATYLQLNGVGVGTFPAPVAIAAPCTNVGAAVIDIYSSFCNSGNPANPAWPLGFAFRRGSLVKDATGVQLEGCLGFANIPCGSYKISMTGYDAGNVAHTGFVAANSAGDIVVTPFAGAALRSPISIPASLGPTLNNLKFVDGQSSGFTTTGAVADGCENYPTNNGLRSCIINSPPELITVDPFPPNFSVEWRIWPGNTNSTLCNTTNINCLLTAVPIIMGSNASIWGTAGPVGSSGNFSGGSALVAADTFPSALGVPSGGATVTCNGVGALTAPFIAIRGLNNLETHPGKNPASGFSAYVKKTGCTNVTSITITAPSGFNAGAIAAQDFEVGVSQTVNGVYYLQLPGSGLVCGVGGIVNNNEACRLTGGATINTVQSQTCSSSCTQPFEVDLANNGNPIDTSNPLIVFGTARAGGGWATQTFNTQIRDISIACQPTGHGASQPNVMIWDISAEENSGFPTSQVQLYGDCGGYTNTSGSFIYVGPWAPNSNFSHFQASGGPIATANPFWGVIVDAHPTSPPSGGASGGTRVISDMTIALRGGATANGAVQIEGNRGSTGVDNSHVEILNGNDAYVVTDGANAQFSHVEAFTTGIGLHIFSTAGMVEASVFCNQGTNSSNQVRCTPGATSIQDDTVGGMTITGPVPHYTSGTFHTKSIHLNPMTFTDLTSLTTCAAGTEGYEYGIKDSTTAVFNANITVGGGGVHVIAYCNGTNWTVH